MSVIIIYFIAPTKYKINMKQVKDEQRWAYLSKRSLSVKPEFI